jgi:hypothetical protein
LNEKPYITYSTYYRNLLSQEKLDKLNKNDLLEYEKYISLQSFKKDFKDILLNNNIILKDIKINNYK